MIPATAMPDDHGKTRPHLRWLRDQLPELVERDVLDTEAAARIRAHYALGNLREPRSVALLIFGVLGALLVGAGLILIIAHNWEDLGRGARAAIAIGLLLASQTLAGFTLLRRPDSAAWSEASALFLTLCIGAATALISQTYNIEGELGDFVLTWLGLALPLVYLLRARISAVACLLLALFLPEARDQLADFGFSYLLIVGLIVPFIVQVTRSHPGAGRTLLLQWTFALTLPIGLAMLVLGGAAGDAEELALPIFTGLFTSMHVLGTRRSGPGHTRVPGFRTPLSSVGLLGAALLAIIMSFDDAWPRQSALRLAQRLDQPEVLIGLVVAAALSLAPLRAAVADLRARRLDDGLLRALPLLPWVGLPVLAATGSDLLPMLLGNAYTLALGIVIMLAGLSALSLGRTNVGLFIIAILAVVRFLDSEFSMATRGLSMVLVGGAFVGVNIWLVRRNRERPAQSEASS